MLQKTPGRPDAKSSAKSASLIHITDEEPGIVRKRAGTGFSYRDPYGKLVKDAETLDRIRCLAIPPAYSDVWISPDADGHIQATGRDDKGRKQYRYHARWTESRDEVKYGGLVDFARALPSLRAEIESDLGKRGLPYEKVVASIVWLLDNTMIRVGNAAYARDNKSFGLTTLRDRHVEIDGAKMRFAFKGKSGKEWTLKLADRRIARIVRDVQDIAGQQLFQYYGEDGARHPVRSQDVNLYLREASGSEFTSKHFRTWGGTVTAATLFAGTPLPATKREAAQVMNTAIDAVSNQLGNTRAVCRKCYIHPTVFEAWSDGRLAAEMKAAKATFRKPANGLSEDETLVLKWLEKTG